MHGQLYQLILHVILYLFQHHVPVPIIMAVKEKVIIFMPILLWL